ncbi:restriction endonuclease subunit S [Pectobacterium actinidiae]|uniref:restriction endonuclease subunit S n=1 Tax=Pectobacterium actinidiae TaxID=1507808 RepID=UPI0032F06BCA
MRIDSLSTVIAALESGKRPKGGASSATGTVPSLGGEHLNNDGGFRLGNLKYIDEEFFANLKSGIVRKNDILIVKDGATTGKVSYVSSDFPFERAAINEHLFALTVDSAIAHPRYVFSFLKSPQGQKEILKDFRGAAIGGISRGFAKLAKIPLPSPNDQIRIVHLLDKVEGLIAQREQHLQQLDKLLKSVFLEMFGDPVRNEKGWNKIQFSELLTEIESGKSPKCEARRAESNEWGVLKLGAVTRCKFDESENKALPNDVIPSARDEVKAGDLLFSRKNTYELVAACAYVFSTRPKLLMPDLIFRFIFKQGVEINPIFMWKLLTCDSQRKAIQSLAAGAAGSMPNISKTNLKTARLPIPPLTLQNQFATIVEKVESIKSRYQQSLADLEALYGALSQQAFKGELDLSRVPLPNQPATTETIGDEAAEYETVAQADPVIHFPAANNLPTTLENSEARKALIVKWLEAYRGQLGGTPFSVQDFMAEAQTQLAEQCPDNDVKLDVNDYENIKRWVFQTIDAGLLQQSQNITDRDEDGAPIFGNVIELKAVSA